MPEQDGSRPISQRYWMRYSKEEVIMKKVFVKFMVVVVMLSMGFLSYDNFIESNCATEELLSIRLS